MCCAIVALIMWLIASWRSMSATGGGRAGRWRRLAIVLIAMAAAAGSAMAADRFAVAGRAAFLTEPGSAPLCGHFFR